MTKFVLQLDLANHEHHPAAQHALAREWLALAGQAIGSGSNRKGSLTVPVWDVNQGLSHHLAVGSWQFIETETHNAEA